MNFVSYVIELDLRKIESKLKVATVGAIKVKYTLLDAGIGWFKKQLLKSKL